MKSFFFHFHKPMSQKMGKPIISLHFDKTCHLIEDIEVSVPTKAKFSDRQPRFKMHGYANSIKISKGKAVIN